MELAFQSTVFFPLRDLIILDSEVIIHVFNNLSQFSNFRKAPQEDYLLARSSKISILEYENVILQSKNEQVLHLKDVTFCTDFVINLMSFRLLKANDIF